MNDVSVNSQIIIAVISAIGGIVCTYIAVRYRRIAIKTPPRDRIDVAFDAYDKIIKQQSEDLDSIQGLVDRQREQLNESQTIINSLQVQLQEYRLKNQQLEFEVKELKNRYKAA